jgi:hypothetical protein
MNFGTMVLLARPLFTGVLTIPVRFAAQSSSSEVTSFDAAGAGTAGQSNPADPTACRAKIARKSAAHESVAARQMTPRTIHSAPAIWLQPTRSLSNRLPK